MSLLTVDRVKFGKKCSARRRVPTSQTSSSHASNTTEECAVEVTAATVEVTATGARNISIKTKG